MGCLSNKKTVNHTSTLPLVQLPKVGRFSDRPDAVAVEIVSPRVKSTNSEESIVEVRQEEVPHKPPVEKKPRSKTVAVVTKLEFPNLDPKFDFSFLDKEEDLETKRVEQNREDQVAMLIEEISAS